MMRVGSLALGAVTFLVAHLIERAAWDTWFAPLAPHPAWFLNGGRAVALTTAAIAAAAVISGARSRRGVPEGVMRGCNVAAGAFVAMVVVLVVIGPGTIFPIVLAIGGMLLLIASISGGAAGAFLRGRSVQVNEGKRA